jgi:hypothetical protein
MNEEHLIRVEVVAMHHGIELQFIQDLHERGLIHLVDRQEATCMTCDDLVRLERLARLHYDLEINAEGLEAIDHLLERMDALQQDLRDLRGRLRLYESEE